MIKEKSLEIRLAALFCIVTKQFSHTSNRP